MLRSDFEYPIPLVDYTTQNGNFNDLDNDYTSFYKYAHTQHSPISSVVFIKTDNNSTSIDTYANLCYKSLNELNFSNYSEVLASLSLNISNSGNTVKNEIFLYEYTRASYKFGGLKRYSNDDISRSVIASINSYSNELALPYEINSVDDLSEWIVKMNFRFKYDLFEDTKRYNLILKVQGRIGNVAVQNWFEESDLVVLGEVYMIKPVSKIGEEIRPEIGDYIFDNMIVSDRIPYINYNDSFKNNYRKVYSGLNFDIEPDYNNIVLDKKRGSKQDTIEFTMWLGNGSIYKTTKESIFSVVYDLKDNTIIYLVPVSQKSTKIGYNELAFKYIKECFSRIFIMNDDPVVIQSKTEFNLYPLARSTNDGNIIYDPDNAVFPFREYKALDLFTNSDMYRHILNVDESVIIYPRRLRFEFLYNPMFMRDFVTSQGATSWSLTFRQMYKRSSYPATNNSVISGRDGMYLRIRIDNANSEADAIEIKEMLIKMLCLYYNDNLTNNTDQYTTLLGDKLVELEDKRIKNKILGKEILEVDEEKSEINREGGTRLKAYRNEYPSIFIPPFQKVCPSHKTPEIFKTLEEANNWSEKNSRKILQYPDARYKTMFWFGCPHKDYVYPNIISNVDPSTQKDIQYFPCCSDADTTKKEDSDYKEFYEGKTKRKFGPSKIIISTDKYLRSNDKGTLPPDVKTYLSSYNNDNNIEKRGIIDYPSPNSFLHCVLYAIEDQDYMLLFNRRRDDNRISYRKWISDREDYVISVRKKLAASFYPSLLKQELYDILDDRQIIERVADTDSFFDPLIFYRALEEVLSINIFVFSIDGYDIPRHRSYSVRQVNNKNATVLVYKNAGPKISKFIDNYPHCELIVDTKNAKFGRDMTRVCYNAHTAMMTTLTISNTLSNETVMYSNQYYFLNYRQMFGATQSYPNGGIVSQHIDGYGKAAAFNVVFDATGEITIYVPPGQPLNVPSTTVIRRGNVESVVNSLWVGGVNTIPYVNRDSLGEIVALWFSVLDIKACLYVPTTGKLINPRYIEGLKNKPQGEDAIPNLDYSVSDIEIYNEQKRTASVLMQLVEWVFDISRKEYGDTQNLDYDFSEKLFGALVPAAATSYKYYGISRLRQMLPDIKSHKEAFIYLKQHTENLVFLDKDEYKFVFHSDLFLRKMYEHLRKYYKETLYTYARPKKTLLDFRSTYLSFKQTPGVEVFINKKEFQLWMKGRKEAKEVENEIYTKVLMDFSNKENPYIYQGPDGITFLIQNIQGLFEGITQFIDQQRKAIKVARTWKDTKVNLGFFTTMTEDDEHIIGINKVITYGIGKSGSLIPYGEDFPSVGNPISILVYGNKSDFIDRRGSIAAMLPLL